MTSGSAFSTWSQYWTTQALYYVPAAAVSPFNYMALIWGSILGSIIWDQVPTVPIVTCATIVTLTGLYLLRHEAYRRRPPRPARRTRPGQ
jgi:drug/metabolite transporter (DMT)-like permease